MHDPGIPSWAVFGDANHRRNLIASIDLDERDLERANSASSTSTRRCRPRRARKSYHADDADVLLVACNTPARAAKGAMRSPARAKA